MADTLNSGGFFSGTEPLTPQATEQILDEQLRQQRGLLGSYLAKQGIGVNTQGIVNNFQDNPQMVQAVKMKKLMNDVSADAKSKGIDVSADPIGFSKLVAAHAINNGMPDVAQKALDKAQEQTIALQKSANETTQAGAAMINADANKNLKAAQAVWESQRADLMGQLNEYRNAYWQGKNEATVLAAQLKGRNAAQANADLKVLDPKNIYTKLQADDRFKNLSSSDQKAAAVDISLRARQLYKTANDPSTDVNDLVDQASEEAAKNKKPSTSLTRFFPLTANEVYRTGGMPQPDDTKNGSPTTKPSGADLTKYTNDELGWITAAQQKNPNMSLEDIIKEGKKRNRIKSK